MANFENLPDEILLAIVGQVRHDSLPAVARLSKQFNRCANAMIYRFVHFSEPPKSREHKELQFPDWTSKHRQPLPAFDNCPRGDSRIYQISLFLRTVLESQALRLSIRAASFKWRTRDIEDKNPAWKHKVSILKWPKALKTFHFYIPFEYSSFPYLIAPLSAGGFVKILRPQRKTLEELYLNSGAASGRASRKAIKLRVYPKFKRVGLALEVLFISRYREALRRIHFGGNEHPTISELLPAGLEELQLELYNGCPFASFFEDTPPEKLNLRGGELSDWLCEIVRNKKSHYPALRYIVLWQEVRDGRDQFDPHKEPGCAKVVAASEAAQVQISWVASRKAPLFSSSPKCNLAFLVPLQTHDITSSMSRNNPAEPHHLYSMGPPEFFSTEHCGLCRLRFPVARLRGLDSWQSDFRAEICFYPDNQTNMGITHPATLGDVLEEIDVAVSGHRRIPMVTILRQTLNRQNSRLDQTAFCFHDWCYSILMWKVSDLTKLELYRLIRALTLGASICGDIYQDHGQLDPPSSMLKLPIERRFCIWEYVGLQTAYSAFVLVAGETTRLARSLNCFNDRKILSMQEPHLSIKKISVFGIEYIQELYNMEASKSEDKISGSVTGLIFAESLGGICAIKVLGIGWNTGWHGKVPDRGHVWFGFIKGTVSRLLWNYSGLHCTSISDPGSFSADQTLWDHPSPPSVNPDAAIFDFERDIIGSIRPDKAPRKRFYRYLPLLQGNEYVSGLTIYLTGNGILGLEAHFTKTSHLSGCRKGCAIHFSLHPRERIVYAWLRTLDLPSPALAIPTLRIQTTFGRAGSFGSHILPQQVMTDKYKWILLKSKGCISGFYYEAPISPVITRLAVTSDATSQVDPPLTPQYATWGIPSPTIAARNSCQSQS
ncbi:uncharacterized protein BP5553_01626 [Venustampulla echinocandica]|uniref:F-box domain-containing protein n=1 Tax=Venustampulla echinocandica TaxID=2656787 RepID=A0A370U1K6_9HELO|nr:uncharacterized protein BP5553_01626 [Venustampulla echinocandica]RDL41647.1 hypothetical protein BP5553_01626 [Venustampulla echinocandica]